jgi:Na+-transporting NADH:ubiquinone oxidoreductase subunit NqrB
MSTADIIYNVLGMIGAAMLLFGFYRVNSGKWTNKSFAYELDNLVGAVLIIIYQVRYHAFVTVVVNAIWAIIALIGLVVFVRRMRHHRRKRRA